MALLALMVIGVLENLPATAAILEHSVHAPAAKGNAAHPMTTALRATEKLWIPYEIWGNLSSGTEQTAERGLDFIRTPEKHPSGPKGLVVFAAFMARLKSCPDTKRLFETHFTSISAICITPATAIGAVNSLESTARSTA